MSRVSREHLGDFVRIRTGKLDANANTPDGEYPFFTCSRVPLRISTYSYDCECVLVAGNGDLNVKYYKGKFDAYQRTYIIESLDSKILSPKYLFRFLSTYIDELRRGSVGGVIKFIKLGHLTKAPIFVPPLVEQGRIVKLLDEADELRRLRAQADQRTDALIPALFHEMFGDPINNYLKQSVNRIDSFCKVVGGGTPSKKVPSYWVGKIPWVSPKDMSGEEVSDSEDHISEDAIKESATNLIPAGSILIVTRSGILKHTLPIAINSVPVTINQDIKAFIPNADCNAVFFAAQLRMLAPTILNMVRVGATVQNLETDALKQLSVLCPPLSQQKEFAHQVSEIRKVQTEQAASHQRLNDLFQSMLHRAFNINNNLNRAQAPKGVQIQPVSAPSKELKTSVKT